jgi:hypothetical protein
MQAYCTLVGTHFRGSEAKRIVNALTPGPFACTFEREPDNEHDENAVAVYFEDEHIGYISRNNNEAVAQALDLGAEITAEIVDFEGRKPVMQLSWED